MSEGDTMSDPDTHAYILRTTDTTAFTVTFGSQEAVDALDAEVKRLRRIEAAWKTLSADAREAALEAADIGAPAAKA